MPMRAENSQMDCSVNLPACRKASYSFRGILVGRLQLDGLIGGGTLNRLKKVYDLEGEAQGE